MSRNNEISLTREGNRTLNQFSDWTRDGEEGVRSFREEITVVRNFLGFCEKYNVPLETLTLEIIRDRYLPLRKTEYDNDPQSKGTVEAKHRRINMVLRHVRLFTDKFLVESDILSAPIIPIEIIDGHTIWEESQHVATPPVVQPVLIAELVRASVEISVSGYLLPVLHMKPEVSARYIEYLHEQGVLWKV